MEERGRRDSKTWLSGNVDRLAKGKLGFVHLDVHHYNYQIRYVRMSVHWGLILGGMSGKGVLWYLLA